MTVGGVPIAERGRMLKPVYGVAATTFCPNCDVVQPGWNSVGYPSGSG